MAREKFEKEIDAVIFRSAQKDVFAFLKEHEDKKLITLYAGTYSFDMAINVCNSCEKATFYFYLNGYKYGYALTYFQGRFNLERDENIFSHKSVKRYSKKALSNYRIDKRDMRSGEYYKNNKDAVKNQLFEGLMELVLCFICFAIGIGIMFLFGIEDIVDGEAAMILGMLVLVVVVIFAVMVVGVIKAFRKKKGEKNEK